MQVDIVLESKIGADRFKALGLLAEQHGFRAIWVQNYARAPDAFMTAVPLALAAKHIHIGVAVISPYEMHPLKIANALLTLNEYAGGRACVVVGAGGEWPGVMKLPLGRRITRAREALQIIKGACTEGVLNFAGVEFNARGFSTPWVTQAAPLIYAGANGPQMASMASGIADGIMMSDVQPEMFAWGLPALRESLTEAGRVSGAAPGQFRLNNFLSWHVKKNRAESLAEARRELIIRGWLEPQWIEPFLAEEDVRAVLANRWPFLQAFRDRSGDIEGVATHIVDALVDGLTCSGDMSDLDRHIARLLEYKAAGFSEIALGLQDDPEDAIAMIGKYVLPALR